jgi:type I restriction enzyme S subunit
MADWRKCTLGDVCKISSSKRIFAKEYVSSGVPFFRGKEIIEKQHLREISTELYITEERYAEISRNHGTPKKGDLLLTSVGTLGVPYIIGEERFYFKDGNITWLHNFNGIDNTFLYYWFLSPIGKHNINTRCIGSTQKALPIDTLLKFPVDLPPLAKQVEIGRTLRALDDKIANNTKINNHLEQMAQAIFKSWFVDNVSDSWNTVDLGTVTQEIRAKVKGQQMPVLSAVRTGNLVLSEDYFTKQVYSKDIGKYIIVEPNDFAYNPARVNIGSLGINGFDFAGCVSPVYVVFHSEREYHHFLSFFLKSPNFQEEVRVRASGSVRQSLNYGDFALIQVTYPPIDLVREFNYQYEGILAAIRQLGLESARLAALRDTLLPRLMSGELSAAGVDAK